MNNFKVGEKVVALTNPRKASDRPRVAGQVYTVLAVSYCSSCGMQAIDIGGRCQVGNLSDELQCNCGLCRLHYGRDWTSSIYFTRPISNTYKLEVAIPELLTIKETQLQ